MVLRRKHKRMAGKMQVISKRAIWAPSAMLLLRLMAIAFMFIPTALFAQSPRTNNCSKYSSFLALSASDVESRVISRKDMSGGILATIAAKADIQVRVYVDEHGSVVCVKATGKRNPLRSLAEEAAMKWRFTPFMRRDSPTPFQGIIVFHVDL